MSLPTYEEIEQQKRHLRVTALEVRGRLHDKPRLSAAIVQRLVSLAEYEAAGTISCYVSTEDEVHTHELLQMAWSAGKRTAVPYIAGGRIVLFRLDRLDELAPGHFGILEPKRELRGLADRRVEPDALELVVVPGVAFDQHCGRLGHGKGHYDNLLPHVGRGARRIGLAFECQIVDEVPMLPHDVFLHAIVTERAIYTSHGR
jgi:5-formyltetrahydrofolate cyclo-ligase